MPVSVDVLPDGASEIDFSETVDERTGWRTGEISHTFKNTGKELVYTAAKAALVHEDYDVTTASLQEGVVLAEYGIAKRWSPVAGIYLNQSATETQIRIIVKFAVDITWPFPEFYVDDQARKLLDAMGLYIDAEVGAKPDSTAQ